MGRILNSKTATDGSIIFEVLVDYEEALQLKGHVKNIHLFSEEVPDTKANISIRGKNDSTKYFLIPKQLRKDLKLDNDVRCQKIENEGKTVFIYIIDKLQI